MNITDPKIQLKRAQETKAKRENIIQSNQPYPCRKCGQNKLPDDFVIQYEDNHRVGKYRFLYECKACKKARTYQKRHNDRQDINWAFEILYKQLQSKAKSRKIEFLIKKEDLEECRRSQWGKCYYTHSPMTYECIHYKSWSFTEKTKYQVSYDRLDNTQGYTKQNIVLCCTIINKMKWTLSEQEFYEICKKICKIHKR